MNSKKKDLDCYRKAKRQVMKVGIIGTDVCSSELIC